ncbi:MAG: Ig-like domain-containing protein [bacterium]
MSGKKTGCNLGGLLTFLLLVLSVFFFLSGVPYPRYVMAATFLVESTNPSHMQRDVTTDSPITIHFNQPLDWSIVDPAIVTADGPESSYPLFFEINLYESPEGILTHINQEDYEIDPNSIDPDTPKYMDISIIPQPTLNLDSNSEYTYSIHVHYSEDGIDPNREIHFFKFTTKASPEVIATVPVQNALIPIEDPDQDPNVTIHITFSEPMDPNSFSALIDSYQPIPSGAYYWDSNNTVVIMENILFDRNEPFHSIKIVEAYDRAGNLLKNAPFTLHFTTDGFTERPRIERVFPAEAMDAFEKIDLIIMEFDRPMNTQSVENAFYLHLDPDGEIGAGPDDFKWYDDNTRMIFYPDQNEFLYERVYSFGLREPDNVLSLDEQPLESGQFSWTFYSGTEPFWVEQPFGQSLLDGYISSILLDDEGNFWIGLADSDAPGTSGGGVSYFDGQGLTLYRAFDDPHELDDPNSRNVLVSNTIHAMDFDSKGRLWIATGAGDGGQGGVSMRDELGHWHAYQYDTLDPLSFADNNVNALMIDENDRVWLLTDKGICVGVKNGEEWVWTTYNVSHMNIDVPLLEWSSFNSIAGNERSGILFGAGESTSNIIRLNTALGPDDPNAWECIIDNSHTINEKFCSIRALHLVDPDRGKFWIGTTNRGLIEYDINNPATYRQRDEAIADNEMVSAILADKHTSHIWMIVRAQNGHYRLVSYNTSFFGWHTYTLSSDLQGIRINDMDFDSNGNIWVGTDQGRIKCDIIPSHIVVTSPQNHAVNVALSNDISIIFSEPMNHGSVETAFHITPKVEGSFVWENSTTMSFRPGRDLFSSTTYEIVIDTQTRDAANHALYPLFRFDFTTEGQALPITTLYPAENDTHVPVTSRIIIEFEEPMDRVLVEETFCVSTATGCIEGEFLWGNQDATLSFIPSSSLSYGRGYTVMIGNNYVNYFTTVASPEYHYRPLVNSSNAFGDLAGSHITAMTYDLTGGLWIAARPIESYEDAAISYYDEAHSLWTSLRSEDIYESWLDDSIVNKMLFDREGRLWMAMEPDSQNLMNSYAGGVASMYNGQWQIYQSPSNPEIPSNFVNDILVSTSENDTTMWVWIATNKGLGLGYYNKISNNWIWTAYEATHIEKLPQNESFTSIGRAPNGNMWFGTDEGNLIVLDNAMDPWNPSAWTIDQTVSSFHRAINSIAIDSNGDLWLGLADDDEDPYNNPGLIRYSPDSGDSVYVEYGYDTTNTVVPDTGVIDIQITHEGSLGVLSSNNRASVFNPFEPEGTQWASLFVPSQWEDAQLTSFAYSEERVCIGTDKGLLMADDIQPEIESIMPQDLATSVALTTAIEVRFSEPMDKAATEAAFSLAYLTTGALVSEMDFNWQDGNSVLICSPPQLDSATSYLVQISTDAKDSAGNSLEMAKILSFTTVEPNALLTVAQTSPSHGETNESIEELEIMIRFNKAMDHTSTEAALIITPEVESTIVWSSDSTTMIIKVNELRYDQLYAVAISEEAQDAEGKNIPEAYEFSFTTGTPEDYKKVYRKVEGEGCFIGIL